MKYPTYKDHLSHIPYQSPSLSPKPEKYNKMGKKKYLQFKDFAMWLIDNKFKINLGTCKTKEKYILKVAETSPLSTIEVYNPSTIRTLFQLEQIWYDENKDGIPTIWFVALESMIQEKLRETCLVDWSQTFSAPYYGFTITCHTNLELHKCQKSNTIRQGLHFQTLRGYPTVVTKEAIHTAQSKHHTAHSPAYQPLGFKQPEQTSNCNNEECQRATNSYKANTVCYLNHTTCQHIQVSSCMKWSLCIRK